MINSEEIQRCPIRNSTKDTVQCTRSDEINGSLGQIDKEQTLCTSYRPLQHVVNIGLSLIYC